MPTGWRPADVAEKYPVYKIEDVYQFEKFNPASSTLLYAWSWVQITVLLLFIGWLFGNLSAIGSPGMFIYGAFVFFYVYAFSELMDKNKYAVLWELLKSLIGIGIIYYYGNWFGAGKNLPGINIILIAYFIASSLIAAWFVVYDYRKPYAIVNNTASAKISEIGVTNFNE